MIFANVAHCPTNRGKDLGFAYNRFMERLGPEDLACFLDHDACFTTRQWYSQLEGAASKYPDAGFFTCVTNRVWCPWMTQGVPDRLKRTNDLNAHRDFGEQRASKYGSYAHEILPEPPFSGVLILVSKKSWKAVGGFRSGLCGVDNAFHLEMEKIGRRCYLMPGLYVYHWYRADGSLEHLQGSHNPIACGYVGPGTCPACGLDVVR